MGSPVVASEQQMMDLTGLHTLRSSLENISTHCESFLEELKKCVTEAERLEKYKHFREELIQERMAHVEELRQINNDINMLDVSIKQSEVEHVQSVKNALEVHEQISLQHQNIDVSTNLPDVLRQDELLKLHEQLALCQQYTGCTPTVASQPRSFPSPGGAGMFPGNPWAPADPGEPTATVVEGDSSRPQAGFEGFRRQYGEEYGMKVPENRSADPIDFSAIASSSTSGLSKQQPPMKICTSCLQPIHRNAPICPMCKAKSRSKNPKKPKSLQRPPNE